MITLSGHKFKNKFSFPTMRTPLGEALDGTYPVFADQYKFNPGRLLVANIIRDDPWGKTIVEFMAARVVAICMKPPDNAAQMKRVDKDLLLSDDTKRKLIRTLWVSFQNNTRVVCVDEFSNSVTEIRTFSEFSTMAAIRKLQKYISRIESDPDKFVVSIIRNNQIMNLANDNSSTMDVPHRGTNKIRMETSGNAAEWKRRAYDG